MATIKIKVDEELLSRLQASASRAGLTPEELAAATLAAFYGARDPLEFVGQGESSALRGAQVDELLAEGFAT